MGKNMQQRLMSNATRLERTVVVRQNAVMSANAVTHTHTHHCNKCCFQCRHCLTCLFIVTQSDRIIDSGSLMSCDNESENVNEGAAKMSKKHQTIDLFMSLPQ